MLSIALLFIPFLSTQPMSRPTASDILVDSSQFSFAKLWDNVKPTGIDKTTSSYIPIHNPFDEDDTDEYEGIFNIIRISLYRSATMNLYVTELREDPAELVTPVTCLSNIFCYGLSFHW